MKPSRDETQAVMDRIKKITGMTDYRISQCLRELSGHPVAANSIAKYQNGFAVPSYLVYPLISLTNFVVKPHEVRPDVFPAPGQDLPRPASAQSAA